ncbi:H-NS histone family protein [Ralstonia holmesii]|uniref:H-NS histone family protein n=1 Tax=Ralstonia holmesii TaxID=3058602 RepID=UPI003F141091
MATYKQLLAEKAALEAQIEELRAREVQQAIQSVRQLIDEYGLTAADIGLKTSGKGPKPGKGVAPKYEDPKSGATWSGRGREPAWIAGKNRARYLIK